MTGHGAGGTGRSDSPIEHFFGRTLEQCCSTLEQRCSAAPCPLACWLLCRRLFVMAAPVAAPVAAETITHIAVGAEEVKERNSDDIATRLRSYDLRRHRSRAESARGPFACLLTVFMLLAVLYASRRRSPAGVADAFVAEEATGETVHLHRAEHLTAEAQAAPGVPLLRRLRVLPLG